ncbi:MAG TPA: hypothetical protein PKN86_01720 [Candidatus Obscuribacter sp.]|nr:hypothetical protein [Candidatus Obscuribacter sp.]MBK9281015.1 hypothetical protein [Candidatus Obscuribacter sp.]MBL8085247.1 hypothetical protein [Candidatus Obscuribacter sp.]HMY04250.1 hypothetical protein [Candidatus Obscuribacter sp.]HMY51463.1 hypothetical protein [Candidatus Obscuribacter sp.]
MAEAKRVPEEQPERSEFSIDMEGFDQFFAEGPGEQTGATGTAYGDSHMRGQVERLVDRITELMSVSVDQRVETSKIASQLIENQRQLVATQQILIKLMERSIELTRHITSIEERMPALLEVPRVVESLRQRVAQIEGVEVD